MEMRQARKSSGSIIPFRFCRGQKGIRLALQIPPAPLSLQDVGAADPVKVVEGCPELVELLLAQALGISGQYLVLYLIDGAGNGGEQLLPAHTNVLESKRQGSQWVASSLSLVQFYSFFFF